MINPRGSLRIWEKGMWVLCILLHFSFYLDSSKNYYITKVLHFTSIYIYIYIYIESSKKIQLNSKSYIYKK